MQNIRGPGYSTRIFLGPTNLSGRIGANHAEYEGSGIFYPNFLRAHKQTGIFYPNFLRAHKPVRQYWGKPCRI